MGDATEQLLPETVTAYIERGEKAFSKINLLLEAAGGLSLSQVCAVTGLEGSTIQNWIKRGWVEHPKGKRYEEAHIARILIINALKECIRLEQIALLMNYVNGLTESGDGNIIKESELFNYLCESLHKLGQADDLSSSGVEAVVDKVIKGYNGPTHDARLRIRKALTLMIYACVCTDVKRRTESMMSQILFELEHPESVAAEAEKEAESVAEEDQPETAQVVVETRKTVSQALREWDVNSVERIVAEYDRQDAVPDTAADTKQEPEDKPSYRPWYFRKSSK